MESSENWRRDWQTTPIFLPQEPHEQYKKAKDMTLKDELPRSVGAQYATGEITPERMTPDGAKVKTVPSCGLDW